MSSQLSLTMFAHVCGRPEEELDLAEAALLVGEIDHPGVDVARGRRRLDELGAGARSVIEAAQVALARDPDATEAQGTRLEHVLGWLYEDAGFRGNEDEYYDPRNSFLDQVLERRTGIPITLALVLMEVCRRVGLQASGVSFPGHFLVRCDVEGGHFVVDPFTGRILSLDEVKTLYTRATGDTRAPKPRLLEPASKQQILLRMLTNLRGIYASRSDREHMRAVLERMAVIAPSAEVKKELAELGGTTPWRTVGGGLN